MFKYEYEIKLNDQGRPYVSPSKDNVNLPEHKFMGIEIARYSLNQLLIDNQKLFEEENVTGLTDEQEQAIADAGVTLDIISDQIAIMLLESKNALDDLGLDVEDDN